MCLLNSQIHSMYLLFDLSVKDRIRITVFDETMVHEHDVEGVNRDLLVVLDTILKKEGCTPTEVKGCMVVVGAGGFTSTRLAVTVANAFGYALGIPLLALTKDEAAHPEQYIGLLLQQPKGQYISATYSGEANIGNKK